MLSAQGRTLLRGSNVFRAGVVACLLVACEPDVKVGTWSCPWPTRVEEGDDPTKLMPVNDPQAAPWSTSFEAGICDYNRVLGYCYHATNAKFSVVDQGSGAPVRTGHKSIEFSVAVRDEDGQHSRCVIEGGTPAHAIYGAYFYVPEWVENKGNWNLMYFPGGSDLAGLWDVSVRNRDEKDAKSPLQLYLWDHGLTDKSGIPTSPTNVPIGQWFHVEVRLLRAEDATGEIELRQDGETLVLLKGVITDKGKRGQWYVGNLANNLGDLMESTIYVDDVSVTPVP